MSARPAYTGIVAVIGWMRRARSIRSRLVRKDAWRQKHTWRDFSYATGALQVTVLRAPGIYALERLPYASVLADSPVLLSRRRMVLVITFIARMILAQAFV